jgi:superfamily II DNA/RNA helicase
MVCDSTYLVDQETNHQTKLDELFNILEELFVMEGEKVVIFSQWERMTRLVANGLTDRNVPFEYLHGGVPGKKREGLFTNFNNDPKCRVFLSTDAGGVGLNLQVAAYIINLDIPWNPAVLEQRIGRIYRLGQKRNVSVINLVSQDSIEHKMLSLLKFKTSVAAGILDNGEDSIFMGDDRFKQFMQSVESITQDITTPVAELEVEEQEEAAEVIIPENKEDVFETLIEEPAFSQSEAVQDVSASGTKSEEVMGNADDLIQHGMQFLSKFINTLSDERSIKQLAGSITEKDEKTGQTYLKLPVDSGDTVEKALGLLGRLLNGFGR